MVGKGDDVEAAFRDNVQIVGGIALGLILLVAAAAIIVGRGITRPLGAVTGAMGRLAGGDTAVEVSGTGARDEIGALARALARFKDNALEMAAMRTGQEAARERAAAERRQGMLGLADSFEASVSRIVGIVSDAATELERSAKTMTVTADEAGQRAESVAAGAREASGNVQTVAAAAEQLQQAILYAPLGERTLGQAATAGPRLAMANLSAYFAWLSREPGVADAADLAQILTAAFGETLRPLDAIWQMQDGGDAMPA